MTKESASQAPGAAPDISIWFWAVGALLFSLNLAFGFIRVSPSVAPILSLLSGVVFVAAPLFVLLASLPPAHQNGPGFVLLPFWRQAWPCISARSMSRGLLVREPLEFWFRLLVSLGL